MRSDGSSVDIVMAGTFSAWRLGTLQARALPFARELHARGVRCAIVTTPWDAPAEAGVIDAILGVELRNTPSANVLSFPLAVAQQMRHIHLVGARAIHIFKPKGFGGLVGWQLRKRYPLIVDSDDWEGDGGWNQAGRYSLLQRRMFQWQEMSLLREADAVTAASQLLAHRANALRRHPPTSVTWIPNGLETTRLRRLRDASERRDASPAASPSIVLYSRFAEFPTDWLPRYLARLSQALPQSSTTTINVIGETQFAVLGAANLNVNFLGYVAYNRVEMTLGSSHIAIFPYTDSLIARSKNSVKLLELMAAGCAVIGSRIGDIPAVTGDAALLIDGSDPGAIAVATAELLRNPDRVQRLSAMSQHRVRTQFAIPAITDRLIETYRTAGVLPPCLND